MRCLCHLWAHAVYALGWPLVPFEDPQEEYRAYRACSAYAGDAAYVRDSRLGAATMVLAALFRDPSLRHNLFIAPSLSAGQTQIEPLNVWAYTELLTIARGEPVNLLVPKDKPRHMHADVRFCQADVKMGGSFLQAYDDTALLVPAPPVHVLLCARKLDALALAPVISEYCGTYRIRPDLASGHLSGARQLTTLEQLGQFTKALPAGTKGRARLQAALGLACDNSASPRETAIAVLLVLARRQGGAGLARPLLNQVVALSPEAAALAGCRKIKPDFIWPEQRVCLEYQGADYHSGYDKSQSDNNRVAALEQDGYRCLQVTNKQVSTPQQFALFAGRLAELLNAKTEPLDAQDPQFLAAHRAVMSVHNPW